MSNWPGMVSPAFNPSTWESEASGSLSSRPAWFTESSRTARTVTQRNPVFFKKFYFMCIDVKVSDPELQTVVSCHVGAGNWTCVLWRAVCALNLWAISPVPRETLSWRKKKKAKLQRQPLPIRIWDTCLSNPGRFFFFLFFLFFFFSVLRRVCCCLRQCLSM